MKRFESPELEMEKLDLSDIITTSGCTDDICWEDGDDWVCHNEIGG